MTAPATAEQPSKAAGRDPSDELRRVRPGAQGAAEFLKRAIVRGASRVADPPENALRPSVGALGADGAASPGDSVAFIPFAEYGILVCGAP
jgi:hypothetical protein